MGLTEAVLAICEANIDGITRRDYGDDVDYDSQEYYEWLVDESDKMADYIFEGIDRGIEEYFMSNMPSFPQSKK